MKSKKVGNLSSGARGKGGRGGGTYSCGCPPAPSLPQKLFSVRQVSEIK